MSAVLVIGSGGREHALAWKLSLSPRASRVVVAPGNDGMLGFERWAASLAGGQAEFERLARQAKRERIDLVVVGPDNPLADGMVDVMTAAGLNVFGPTKAAARIEASKAFAKEVMTAAGVPTARFAVAESLQSAKNILAEADWIRDAGGACVVKADGLALGKGVRVCQSAAEANAACEDLIGISGQLLIEEMLSGREVSWMAFCDGERAALLEPARDHKRLRDGDQGPNTGGMGAYSPVPEVPAAMAERVEREVFAPVLAEMRRRGCPFRGVLYAGLMVDFAKDRYWVLEFNARFGDPEAQVLLPRISDDLYDWCDAVARGDLASRPARVGFKPEHGVYVVAAAQGYPESPRKGDTVTGLSQSLAGKGDLAPRFFSAGLSGGSGELKTSGGRVLGALGMGASFAEARTRAYDALGAVRFEGMQFRRDIGAGGAS